MPSYFYICPHISAVVGKNILLYKEVGKIKLLSQYLILSHFLLKQSLNKKCTPLLVFTVCNSSRACVFFCRMAAVLKLCHGLCVYSRPKYESAFHPRLSSFAVLIAAPGRIRGRLREALLTAMED